MPPDEHRSATSGPEAGKIAVQLSAAQARRASHTGYIVALVLSLPLLLYIHTFLEHMRLPWTTGTLFCILAAAIAILSAVVGSNASSWMYVQFWSRHNPVVAVGKDWLWSETYRCGADEIGALIDMLSWPLR